jgi:hypothetical protein
LQTASTAHHVFTSGWEHARASASAFVTPSSSRNRTYSRRCELSGFPEPCSSHRFSISGYRVSSSSIFVFDPGSAAVLADTESGAAEAALVRLAEARPVTEDATGRFTMHDLLRLYAPRDMPANRHLRLPHRSRNPPRQPLHHSGRVPGFMRGPQLRPGGRQQSRPGQSFPRCARRWPFSRLSGPACWPPSPCPRGPQRPA